VKLKGLLPKNRYLGIGIGVAALVALLYFGPRLIKKSSGGAPRMGSMPLPVSPVEASAGVSPVSVGLPLGAGSVEAGNPFYTAAGQTDVNETSTLTRFNPIASMRTRAYQATSPYRQNRILT
jgi:ABC-type antimicrobial peptide transport system permease subunit